MTKQTFSGVCAVLAALPSQTKWDDGTAAIYLTIMKDWDDIVVGTTMRHVLLHCEFRPTVAELRKKALGIFGMLPPAALLADKATDIIRNWASNRNEHAAEVHPMLPEIVARAGGWTYLGMSDSHHARQRFFDAYNEVMAGDDMDKYLTQVDKHQFAHIAETGMATAKALAECAQ